MSGPVRLQLSRRKGFSLQALSLATNGLPAVKVDRATIWGNPFVPGRDNPMIPGRKVEDKRHAARLFQAHAPLNETLVAAARAELKGKNLACWCGHVPYEPWMCHVHTLIEIANA